MTEAWGAVLVVDDDAEMRELVHDVLKGPRASGHDGRERTRGLEAAD
jgi:CheY-like chemotaxis protein